jgi:hypothetical protein
VEDSILISKQPSIPDEVLSSDPAPEQSSQSITEMLDQWAFQQKTESVPLYNQSLSPASPYDLFTTTWPFAQNPGISDPGVSSLVNENIGNSFNIEQDRPMYQGSWHRFPVMPIHVPPQLINYPGTPNSSTLLLHNL